MPQFLARQFSDLNNRIDAAVRTAEKYAVDFQSPQPRTAVVECYLTMRALAVSIETASGTTGMAVYAKDQWGDDALDFIAKAQEIQDAAEAVTNWIEGTFPTVGSVIQNAMDALSVPAGQQASLLAELGTDVDFALIDQFNGGVFSSPTIPPAPLAPLVSLLGALATAATI